MSIAAFPHLLVATTLALIAALAPPGAAGTEPRLDPAEVLRTDRIDHVVLSPGGRRIAYTQRDGLAVSLVIRELDPPGTKSTVRTDLDERRGFFPRRVTLSVRVSFLAWADDDALVYAVELPPDAQHGTREELHVVDARGRDDRTLLDRDDVEALYNPPVIVPDLRTPTADGAPAPITVPDPIPVTRPLRVLGFADGLPVAVLMEARGNRLAPTTVYRVEVRSGSRVRVEENDGEDRYLYDRRGHARVRETRRIRDPGPLPGVPMKGPRPRPLLVRQFYDWRDDEKRWRRLDDLAVGAPSWRFNRIDEELYAPRSFPLALAATPDQLYVATAVGRDTWGVSELDLRTGRMTDLAPDQPGIDLANPTDPFGSRALVFDRQGRLQGVRIPGERATTRWCDARLVRLQQQLEDRFPGRDVRIGEWTDDLARLLVLVTGSSDPGRYFLVEPAPELRVTELLRRASALPAAALARVERFAVAAPDGRIVRGAVTLPTWARRSPPPLVIRLRDVPGRPELANGFNRLTQLFAAAGYEVIDVEFRGVAGLGQAHRDAVRADFVGVPLDDVAVALGAVARSCPFDARRVAVIGEGFGGFLALRSLGRIPARCVIAIDPPADFSRWLRDEPWGGGGPGRLPSPEILARGAFFGEAEAELARVSPMRDPVATSRPVLLVHVPERFGGTDEPVKQLRDLLRKRGGSAEMVSSTGARDEAALGGVYRKMIEFLDETLFRYRVDIGEEREVR